MERLVLLTQLPEPVSARIKKLALAHGYRVETASDRDQCQRVLLNTEVTALIIHAKLVAQDRRLLEVLKFYSNKVQLILYVEETEFDPREYFAPGVVGLLPADQIDEKMLLILLHNAERFHGLEEKVESLNALVQDNQSNASELNMKNKVLERERNFNEAIISAIAYGLMIVDADGGVIMLNEVGRGLFGVTVTDILGQDYRQAVSERFRDAVSAAAAEVLKGEGPREVDGFAAGDDLIVTCAISAIRDGYNNVLGLMFLGRDITEGERVKAELFQAEKLATMGTLLSGIAHELRNPLTIINARAQRLLTSPKEPLNDRIKKGVESIEAQSKRCGDIVNNLLDFARFRAGGFEFADVRDIIDRSIKFLELEGRTKEVRVTQQYEGPVTVRVDRVQMEQVFLNLFSNAADAMEGKGSLDISTGDAGAFVKVTVADSGPGIPLELQKKIFDPFFTTKEAGKGTGLGLSIVYRIIQRHKGRVAVKSEPGTGASFTLLLPKE